MDTASHREPRPFWLPSVDHTTLIPIPSLNVEHSAVNAWSPLVGFTMQLFQMWGGAALNNSTDCGMPLIYMPHSAGSFRGRGGLSFLKDGRIQKKGLEHQR